MDAVVSRSVDNTDKMAEYARAYADQFDEERRRSGKTYDELAAITGLSRSTLIRYAKGTREIGTVDLLLFLDAVGVDIHRFVDRAKARIGLY